VDVEAIEKDYYQLAYNSTSNRDNYIVVRKPEVTNFLKMSEFNPGSPYLLQPTTKDNGGESNLKIGHSKYYLR
jgi:hypothetical protein